jgi:hypothetical protein
VWARTATLDAAFDQLKIAAATVHVQVEQVRQRARDGEWLADKARSLIGRAYRSIETIDVIRSRAADWRAKRTFQLRSEMIYVLAKGLVKIDGSEIHMD